MSVAARGPGVWDPNFAGAQPGTQHQLVHWNICKTGWGVATKRILAIPFKVWVYLRMTQVLETPGCFRRNGGPRLIQRRALPRKKGGVLPWGVVSFPDTLNPIPKPQKYVKYSPKPIIIAITAIILHTFGVQVLVSRGMASRLLGFRVKTVRTVGRRLERSEWAASFFIE